MDLKKLKELAENATPGAWKYNGHASLVDSKNNVFGLGGDGSDEDLNFVAAANPETILKLLAVIEAARAQPIIEGWNEDRCNSKEVLLLESALNKLINALEDLDDWRHRRIDC